MSHLYKYIITLADDAEDAKVEVCCWLHDYANCEFFDYGRLEEPEQVSLVKDIVGELEQLKAEVLKKIPAIEKDIKYYKGGERSAAEGYQHIRLGYILCEMCGDEMPFFNITNNDWSIPTETHNGKDWYAVMVDLHY